MKRGDDWIVSGDGKGASGRRQETAGDRSEEDRRTGLSKRPMTSPHHQNYISGSVGEKGMGRKNPKGKKTGGVELGERNLAAAHHSVRVTAFGSSLIIASKVSLVMHLSPPQPLSSPHPTSSFLFAASRHL